MKKELSARIQKAIEESRLSYTAISEIIGTISPQAVRAWAVGLSTPTNENISLLAKATNADEVWLLTGREQQDLDEDISEYSNEEFTRLKELIRQSQISQTELAEACGVSKQAVSKWATGAAFPRSERVLILLAKALNTTPEYIRYGNEGMPTQDGSLKQQIIDSVIKAICTSKLTFAEIAERTGFSYQAVRNWAKGERRPSLEATEKLSEVLGLSLPELLIGKDVENAKLEMLNKKISSPAYNFERVKAVIRLTSTDDQKAIFALYLALDENKEIPLSRITDLENELNQNLSDIIDRWFIKTETSVRPIIPLLD